MDNARLAYLFHRFTNNNCTEAEEAEFMDAIQQSQHEVHFKNLMDQLWRENQGKSLSPYQSQSIISAILERGGKIVRLQKPPAYFSLAKIAACLAFIIICSGAAFFYFNNEISPVSPNSTEALDLRQPGFIKLPDGSTVVLNGGSKLEFPESFAGDTREVTLTGEAYFDITHDPIRPFVVHTGKVRTTVLGTAFNIKAYPEQSDITVTVTRGKVKVSDDKQVFGIVNPDQQITFNKNREVTEQKAVDSYEVTAWIEKDIYFEDATIDQAVSQLEKRFGVTIILNNSRINDCKFTATFVKGEDIEQILRVLCDFNNATLTANGNNNFEIHGGTCPLLK